MPFIFIMRHGESSGVPRHGRFAGTIREWIAAYDAAGIVDTSPPAAAVRVSERATLLLSSPMPRAVASAAMLASSRDVVMVRCAREAGLPSVDWPLPVLPIRLWTGFLRLGWFCGVHPGAESVADARVRAAATASRLIACTEDGHSPLLVGHGIMNFLIARELRESGWSGPGYPRHRHWGCSTYSLRARAMENRTS